MPTVDVSVAASGDDSTWSTGVGGFQNTNATLSLGNISSIPRSSAVRFDNVTVPNGATIDVAYITFEAWDSQSGTTVNVTITANDADDPAAVTSQADGDGRTRTTASASWSSIPAFTANNNYNTPSLVSIVQELVDRGGWASGQAMVFIFDDNSSTSSAFRRGSSFDSANSAPALHIEYTAGASGTPIHYYNRRRAA